MAKYFMVTVKGPGNKAKVELLTHPQRQLRYSAFNWANDAISPITLSYLPNFWVHILIILEGKITENVYGNRQRPWE